MGLSAGQSMRGLFTALGVTAAAAMGGMTALPDMAQAFGTGSSSHGGDRFARIVVEDADGEQTYFRLPMPDTDPERFKTSAIDILRDYLAHIDFEFSDRQATRFIHMVESLAEDSAMTPEDFMQEIGLSQEIYDDFVYKRFRSKTLQEYNFILSMAEKAHWFSISGGLEQNDETIAVINEKIAEAARQYPDEDAFKVRPLNSDDLTAIRERIARDYVDLGVRAHNRVARGLGLNQEDRRSLEEMVRVLYLEIGKDPSEAEYDFSVANGNEYNRELIPMMDRILEEEHGVTAQQRDIFYMGLVQIYNFYNKRDPVPVTPPEISANDTSAAEAGAPSLAPHQN